MPVRPHTAPRHGRGLIVLTLAAVLLAVPSAALAYIDPGTGSFVIQGIIAAIVGAGVALRMFWGRIKGAITGQQPTGDEDDDA